MGIAEELLSEFGGDFAGKLVEQAGMSDADAQRFVPEATRSVTEAVGGGGMDLGSLLGAGAGGGGGAGGLAQALLERIDVGALAQRVGIDEGLARTALERLIPLVTGALQDKAGAGGLEALLGGEGAGGALGSLAGKLFGR